MSDTVAPAVRRVAKAERIAALDVLRGFAILAILAMNIPYMGGFMSLEFFDPRLTGWTPADEAVFRTIGVIFDGTQRGMLELLFGAGIMIMTRAAMQPDGPVAVADLHFRRNIWLMVFGTFQALVLMWPGDILLPYGLVALVAFPARTLAPKWKAIAGVVFLLAAVAPAAQRYVERVDQQRTVVAAQAKVAAKTPVSKAEQAALDKWKDRVDLLKPLAQSPKKQEAVAAEKKARLGDLGGYFKLVLGIWTEFNFSVGGVIGLAEILGAMLLGMALYDWGVLQGRRSATFYLGMAVIGYGVGMPLRHLANDAFLRFTPEPKAISMTWDIARMALTLGHVGLINLVLKSAAGARVLSVFQAPGRMPLTIYLSASILGMLILFPGFGLGLFGKFGWAGLEAIAVAIIAGQLLFANLWMRVFESGPIDWVWKSLAYQKLQPFRKAAARAVVLQPAE